MRYDLKEFALTFAIGSCIAVSFFAAAPQAHADEYDEANQALQTYQTQEQTDELERHMDAIAADAERRAQLRESARNNH